MQKRCRRLAWPAVLATLALTMALAARAQTVPPDADVFTAYGVPVDVEAETAAKARDIALVQGQRAGLTMVLRRLTLAEDWPHLPELKDDEIAAMVDSIQVSEEKTSAVRYIGRLIIEFKKDDIRRLLRSLNLPFTESRARPTLVLPVFSTPERAYLFEEDNPWLAAWTTHQAPPGALFPLLLPIGDLEDVSTIDAGMALNGDENALQRIAARYGATNILIAAARPAPAGDVPGLDVSLQWRGPMRSETTERSLTAEPDEDQGMLMRRAVAEIAETFLERWKRETLLEFGQEAKLSARLPLTSLQDWLTARRLLRKNGMVRRFEVASMSRGSVQLWLHYLGEPEQLVVSLAQDNLDLTEENGYWVLRLRGNAGGTARE